MNNTDSRLSAQLMAVDIISQLLASAAPQTLGKLLTEQLRELTGAKTVVLIVLDKDTHQLEVLFVSPERRSLLITADEFNLLCTASAHDDFSPLVKDFPDDHPAKSVLLTKGITSLSRYPLLASRELVGMLLLLDLPGIDRIKEVNEIIHLLAPPIALALNNALAFSQIERQSIELERQVAHRTEQLLQKNAELERAEYLHRTVIRTTMEGFWLVDGSCTIIDVNDAYCAMSGYNREELVGTHIAHIEARDSEDDVAARVSKILEIGSGRFESEHRRKDGSTFSVEVSINYMPIEEGMFSVFTRDISERKLAEEALRRSEQQLRQSQKMEGIGQLAGGIAHDFNNILQVIHGYCVLMQMDSSLGNEQQNMISEIAGAADKAADLTRGLLAFSRKQSLIMKREHLNDIIERVQKFLARIIGEDITLNTSFCEAELPIIADRGQIEQVLINLATNARDAMQDGGVFSVRCERVVLDSSFTDFHRTNVPAGTYSLLTVSDTGAGISKEHLEHIFEPFFTTKEVGKGTGLGLAITYGIIKQHNGFINVYSESGQGTIFRIYLPIREADDRPLVEKCQTELPQGGKETILVAEDEPAVRKLVSTILENNGYETILAEDGEDAIEKFRVNRDRVKLILMDVVMPKKNGREAFEEIHRIRPGTKAVFTSGYTADFLKNRGVSEEGINLIMKPVQPMELLKKVREILDA